MEIVPFNPEMGDDLVKESKKLHWNAFLSKKKEETSQLAQSRKERVCAAKTIQRNYRGKKKISRNQVVSLEYENGNSEPSNHSSTAMKSSEVGRLLVQVDHANLYRRPRHVTKLCAFAIIKFCGVQKYTHGDEIGDRTPSWQNKIEFPIDNLMHVEDAYLYVEVWNRGDKIKMLGNTEISYQEIVAHLRNSGGVVVTKPYELYQKHKDRYAKKSKIRGIIHLDISIKMNNSSNKQNTENLGNASLLPSSEIYHSNPYHPYPIALSASAAVSTLPSASDSKNYYKKVDDYSSSREMDQTKAAKKIQSRYRKHARNRNHCSSSKGIIDSTTMETSLSFDSAQSSLNRISHYNDKVTHTNCDEEEVESVWPMIYDVVNQQNWKKVSEEIPKDNKVRILNITWNVQGKLPHEDLSCVLLPGMYHIYAIGTEECVHSITKSVIFHSKRQWELCLRTFLGDEYTMLCSHALQAIHNIIFVHNSLLPLLSNVQSSAIATGLGNQLGNKGGIGISFCLGCTSFLFVNSHFEAHQDRVARRNAHFHKINNELQLTSFQNLSLDIPASDRFDRVFWSGDLNYRINGNRRMIDSLLEENFHNVLLVNDQLRAQIRLGSAFKNFREGPLNFRPTYKYDKDCDVYDTSEKARIPSWTDRILYKTNSLQLNDEDPIHILAYGSLQEIRSSDHRPVYASFLVSFEQKKHTEITEAATNVTRSEVCSVQ